LLPIRFFELERRFVFDEPIKSGKLLNLKRRVRK